MARETSEAELIHGFSDYEVHRGTLVSEAVTTVTFSAAVVSVEVENFGTGDIFATLDGTAPTSDGSTDTTNVMIKIADGATKGLDKRTTTVKLISTGTPSFQVVGVR